MRMKSLALVAATTLMMLAAPSAAYAAGQNGIVESGEFVFYYNSGLAGSFTDFASSKADLACCTFITSGAGHGLSVKNHAASAANWNSSDARVYYNSEVPREK